MSLHNLPLAAIAPSPTNPRKNITNLDELAASVAKFGVMQPIIVRPIADGYELVCGERRYRASLQAGCETIPAIVRELSDDEAFDLQITENLQRKDINPMEESDAFHALTKRGKSTAAHIAKRFGVSEKYVYDRLALQKCIYDVQEGIRNGAFPIAMGKQFARLNMDDQQQLFESLAKPGELLEVADVKDAIKNQFSLVLDKAPFNIQHPDLVPKAGACTSCPKRSGCNQLLFDDVSSKDICFDKACFNSKVAAHLSKIEADLKSQGYEVVKISARYATKMEGVLSSLHYDEIEPDDDKFESCKTIGLVVEPSWSDDGLQIGATVKIEVYKDEADEEDEDIEETSGEGSSSPEPQKPTTSHNSDANVDHSDMFSKYVASAILDKWDENPVLVNNPEVYESLLLKYFGWLSDELAEYVCTRLGVTIVKNQDGEVDDVATIKSIIANCPVGNGYLLELFYLLNEGEEAFWERDDLARKDKYFSAVNIDLTNLMDEYEQQHNHTFE